VNVTVRRNGDAAEGNDEVVRLRELVRTLTERNRQLEHALESRIVIEQAKGVLSERFAIAPDEAFELIRRAARHHRLRLRDLAREVVSTRRTPDAIAGPRSTQPVSH
jgi:AmiR/NasT family two-component response regulator